MLGFSQEKASPDMSYTTNGQRPIARICHRTIMAVTDFNSEDIMSMRSEGKDARGRNHDKVTKDGTSSAGSLGAGGTGPMESAVNAPAGNQQKRTRTDDLLSDGTDGDGYVGEEAGELQTGMGGIGSLSTGNAGSRQSAQDRDKE
jgi:hypothetical protein